MNQTQNVLIKLLSNAIHNIEPIQMMPGEYDWNSIYEIAYLHQVHTLLFPIIIRLSAEYRPSAELVTQWEEAALQSAGIQLTEMHRLSDLLRTFQQAGLPVIILKGLILRRLYPQPELRTMSDADILVHEYDLEKASALLQSLGYTKGEVSIKHISFYHRYFQTVELHSMLVDTDLFPAAKIISDQLWMTAVKVDFYGAAVLALSPEYQLLHLILHMASHMQNYGFGLRQLCDYTLTAEAYKDRIDWGLLELMLENCKTVRFAQIITALCNQLFGLDIPHCSLNSKDIDALHLEAFLDDIITGGVYGKNDTSRKISSSFLHYVNDISLKHPSSHIKFLLQYTFPSRRKLENRHFYVKKYPFLLPLGWIHRLINSILRKDMSAREKLFFSKRNRSFIHSRAKLLHWLGLRH